MLSLGFYSVPPGTVLLLPCLSILNHSPPLVLESVAAASLGFVPVLLPIDRASACVMPVQDEATPA
jgi:hypothetical protein